MKEWQIDVPVLLIFFARPETFEKVFAAVREARPSTLLLWQDGPREGREDDLEGIARCRAIVEKIDWDCQVYRQYNEQNYGCDPSTFYAHKWAFSLVEKCIVLEDDQWPSETFFWYCKDLLDKYENDNRVNHICGYNVFGGTSDCPADYLFAYNGSGAWASWRRVAQGWDETYSFLHDEYAMKNLRKKYGKKYFDLRHKNALRHAATGVPYWESILGFDCLLNNRYAVIPRKNLVSNIGMTPGSTHSLTEVDLLPKQQRKIFNDQVHELTFPLTHPQYVVPDLTYMDELDRLMGTGHPFRNFYRKCIYVCNCIRSGRCDLLIAGIKRRLQRMRRG